MGSLKIPRGNSLDLTTKSAGGRDVRSSSLANIIASENEEERENLKLMKDSLFTRDRGVWLTSGRISIGGRLKEGGRA